MLARSYLAPAQATSQQPQPATYATRPPVHSTELEQRLNALSQATQCYADAPPPLTRAASDASTDAGLPSGVQTPADYFARMPAAAGYKTSGPGATSVLEMMQMARTQSLASTTSAYSNPATPADGVGVDEAYGGVPEDKQIFDFSEFFESFSVTD
ncbi:hypothetical protein OH76DRAFT_1395543 [Lentinus brumalis]|uniref:Uncharacterized protein n=1 Tax=Lentinus brumalis TaxID=2498619 RepID=A0A371DV59_9APHY|nr:hypothetical protein OH76DRAFT_1395543 [Polyporus brumalis]